MLGNVIPKTIASFCEKYLTVPGGSSRITPMEGLRGYAVFLIFCVHLGGNSLVYFRGLRASGVDMLTAPSIPDAFLSYLNKSHYGVDLFFLLSGFLIFRIIRRDREKFRYPRFMKDRFLRIYPAFFVTLGIVMVAKILLTGTDYFGWLRFAQNLLLLNGMEGSSVEPYNYVTWSLFYELAFYLVFPAILLFRKQGVFDSPARLFAIGLCFCLPLFVLPGPGFARYCRATMFLMGAVIACTPKVRLERISAAIPEAVVILLYLATTTAYAAFPINFRLFTPAYAISCSLLFISACYGTGYLNRLFSFRWLRYLGNVSYSFYLIHAVTISTFLHFFRSPLKTQPPISAFVVIAGATFALSLVLSIILFIGIEKRYFRRRAKHPSRLSGESQTIASAG